MKIAIDARFFGPEGTGIGRYVENLLDNLVELDQENEYVVLLRKSNYGLFNPAKGNFKKILTDARWYSVKEQVIVPAVLMKVKPDLVHFPHLNVPLLWKGKFVLTLHDLTKFKFGGRASSTRALPIYMAKNFGFNLAAHTAVRRAQKVFVPSNFVKKEATKTLGLEESKVVVTHEAVDPEILNLDAKVISEGKAEQILSRLGIKKPFLLYVGNLYPYKNIDVVLDSLAKLNLSLVIVGKRDFFTQRYQEKVKLLKLEDKVNFTGYLPNEDLVALFQRAEAFVFPSLSEGFGLPGLEAMASGCPVVAALASSLPEIYGDAALYFNPKSSSDLVKKLNQLQNEKGLRERLKNDGLMKIQTYSWRQLAEKTLEVYQKVF